MAKKIYPIANGIMLIEEISQEYQEESVFGISRLADDHSGEKFNQLQKILELDKELLVKFAVINKEKINLGKNVIKFIFSENDSLKFLVSANHHSMICWSKPQDIVQETKF